MTAEIVIFSALLIFCNGLSIGIVSEKNVKQSETSIGDAFPDWVPFKNKHGDELGEFVPVATQNKVKKRLAPPMNFLLRSVAEPEGDDYYDKGQGESDNEDTYESKDWSDLNRLAEAIDGNLKVNHTELSDIEGVVNSLTKKSEHSIADVINNARHFNSEAVTNEPESEEEEKEEITTMNPTTTESKSEPNKEKTSEEDVDYDEGSSEKQKIDPVQDVSESEAKKAKILDSVDDLKQRHAEEARSISEKVKEEEMYKEEFERNRMHPIVFRDKYSSRMKYKKTTPDYDEYDDKTASLEHKYKVGQNPKDTTSHKPLRTTQQINDKNHELGKPSVFRNPYLYMVYDDKDEATTSQPNSGHQKFSSKYTTTSPFDSDEERISLVPEDSKEGEPTLFLPIKRKSPRRKMITSTLSPDPKQDTFFDTTASDTKLTDTTFETAPSAISSDVPTSTDTGTESEVTASSPFELSDDEVTGSDGNTANSDSVTDAVPAPSDLKKEETKNENHHHEKGAGNEHDSEYDEEHEEHGKKAYEKMIQLLDFSNWDPIEKPLERDPWYLHYTFEGHHADTKTAKGHHDKENHLGKYDDRGGVDKKHEEESGHYGDHHHEEHGKKHAKYEETGKHSKGHSTKGSHDVHKKEEYEKKVEFFEEEGDSVEEEKQGGFHKEKGHSEGGKFKKGNLKAGHEHHSTGEAGNFGKGGYAHLNKGHKQASGQDSHGKQGHNYFRKNVKDAGKKWVYHHGFPAKTANLVVIDRRGDQYFHGPGYYG